MNTVSEFTLRAEPAFALQAALGEGPVWHDGSLWCVDIEGRRLHRFDSDTGRHESFDAGARIGVAVPTDQTGTWIVGLQHGISMWRPESGVGPEVFFDPEPDRSGNRINDGKVDPRGRFFVGTMDMACREPTGALYRVDADRAVTRVVDSVVLSNGLAWDAERNTLYYIDTPTQRVDAFDWDPDTGVIAGRRTVIDLSNTPGSPDGMSADADGRLWVATWGGGAVLCIDPGDATANAGHIVGRVAVSAPHVTSCCFGGPDLKTLYITTARIGMSHEQLASQPHAGDVFAARVDRPGLPGTPARTA
ncbi:MAG: SMP-30/gluconolactonase/LRE family protein [Planctomycetota bacterium]